MNLQSIVSGDKLLLKLPYDLKDSFRSLFKTATWDSYAKAFVVANTTANKNKWKKFVEMSSAAVEALKNSEHEEATLEELQATQRKIEEEIKSLNARANTARANIEALKAQAAESLPLRDKAKEVLEKLLAEDQAATEERNTALEPVIRLHDAHLVYHLLGKAEQAAKRGYSGKSVLINVQANLYEFMQDLNALGFTHPEIRRIANCNPNRTDKVLSAIEDIDDDVLAGYETLK